MDDFYRFLADEAVVVSSSGVEQSIKEAPSVISVITGEELRGRGYRSIAEALATLPGLTFIDDHVLPNLTIRGIFGGRRGWGRFVKVMIDGQSIAFEQDNTNWLGIGLIPLSIIDRIEVIRGPASTLYGANAFLGIINIITVAPDEVPRAEGRVTGLLVQGNPGAAGELLASTRGDNWQLMAAGSLLHEDRSGLKLRKSFDLQKEPPPLGEPTKDDIRSSRSFYLRGSYQHETLGNFTLSGFWQDLETAAEFQDFSILTHRSHLSMHNGQLRLAWDRQIGDDLTLEANIAYSAGGIGEDERLDVGLGDALLRRTTGYEALRTAVVATYRFWRESHVKAGVDVLWGEHVQPDADEILIKPRGAMPARTILPGTNLRDKSLRNIGYYAQVQFGPLFKTTATAGIRGDQNSVYGDNLSLRGALVGVPFEWLSLKALFGTSIMAPAPDQLYSKAALGKQGIIGNPDLKAQTARTAELAAEIRPGPWLALRLDGFHTEVSDKIEYRRLAVNLRPVNRDNMTILGIELEARSTIDRFSAQLGLAYTNVEREQQDKRIAPDPADQVKTASPELQMMAGLQVFIPEIFLSVYAEARFVSAQLPSRDNMVTNDRKEYGLPSVFLVDLTLTSLGLDLLGTRTEEGRDPTLIYLKVTNLLDHHYAVPGFSGVDVPGLWRAVFVGVQQSY